MDEDLASLNQQLAEELADCNATLKAWFDTSDQALENIGPYLKGAFKGYMRICSSGGMSSKDRRIAEACFDSFVDSSLGHTLTPFIMTLAAQEIKRRLSSKA
jgi:hypothetical protein